MIKLIALDLDGTIVNESLELSPLTHQVLQRAREEKGIHVVIATGRMFPSTLPFAQKLNVTAPVISYQGGMIRDISQPVENVLDYPILYHQPVDMDVASKIIDMIEAEKFHANLYVNDHLYVNNLSPTAYHYQFIAGIVPEEAKDLHKVLTAPPSKMMIIDERCDAIVEELRKNFSDRVNVCRSRHNYCEIVHRDVSKWRAISHVMGLLNVQADEVMTIGDQENDLSMLEAAGLGVAMGNAPDHVKAKAKAVTDTIHQDGAAKAILGFVFDEWDIQLNRDIVAVPEGEGVPQHD